jgi:putative ABC transport system substrate-binding protein
MRRRGFISLLGGAATAWPLAVSTQAGMPLIGVLGGGSSAAGAHLAARLRQGLADGGSVEGRKTVVGFAALMLVP